MFEFFRRYREYLNDNPEGLWFKRKLYGWGWTPARWQGWVVIAIGLLIFLLGITIGETDDAPGATALGLVLMLAFITYFGYKKGEKPKWMWGLPTNKN